VNVKAKNLALLSDLDSIGYAKSLIDDPNKD
jgi:hypothetical protein